MNAISRLFERKSKDILSVYYTAGYPALGDTLTVMDALINNGVDMVEIGMPYSDPVADGPVIERSSVKALENGMSIARLFDQLRSRTPQDKVPLILMGYINPVMQYGYEKFCREAAECGISGLIIPDLPIDEFQKEMKPFTEKYDLSFIFLITPETEEVRVRKIDELTNGFIYAVSSSSVTGRDTDEIKKEKYLQRIQSYGLKNPVLVGFGVRDNKTFQQACRYANGAITGTAYIKAITGTTDFNLATRLFVNELRVRQ